MYQQTKTHEIKTDVRGLIKLLAKNLYAQPDVFIREMIQNANDAIVRRRSLDSNAPPGEIHIWTKWGKGANYIIFEDNGAGLTEQEIYDYLSTIGRTGTGCGKW